MNHIVRNNANLLKVAIALLCIFGLNCIVPPATGWAQDINTQQALATLQTLSRTIRHGRFDFALKQLSASPDDNRPSIRASLWLDGDYAQWGLYKSPDNGDYPLNSSFSFAPGIKDVQQWIDHEANVGSGSSETRELDQFEMLCFFRGSKSPGYASIFKNNVLLSKDLPPYQVSFSKLRKSDFVGDLPMLQAGRPYLFPESNRKECLYTHLANTDPGRWEYKGEESIGKFSCVKFRVQNRTPEKVSVKNGETLQITFGYMVWCSKQHGMLPISISNVLQGSEEYIYQGKTFLGTPASGPHLEVTEVFELTPGVWYPREYKLQYFTIDLQKKNPNAPNSIDATLEQMLTTGTAPSLYGSVLRYGEAVNIAKWTAISPHSHQLWISPPKGTLVVNEDQKSSTIEGMSEEESRQALGIAEVAHQSVPVQRIMFREWLTHWVFYLANGLFVACVAYYVVRKILENRR